MDALAIARGYLRRGWAVVPIPHREKGPVLDEWHRLRLTEADLPRYFNGAPQNVGVLLGAPSGDLVDVDVDATEALLLADDFLPRTDARFGRRSKPSSHRLYLCSPAPATQRFQDVPRRTPDGHIERATLVELRSSGAQTVFPGSVHPAGETITWAQDGAPARVGPAQLVRAVRRLAAAALVLRHYPPVGARHDFSLALAGALLRSGWEAADAEHFIETVARAAGDEEARQRAKNVVTTARRLAQDQPAVGLPTLAKLLPEGVADRLAEWLGLRRGAPGAEASYTTAHFVSSTRQLYMDETNRQGPRGSLPFAPLGEVLAAEPPEPDWAWRGYLAPGAITLLAGRPKSGKTTLYCALVAALAVGADFLGQPTRAERVVLLSEERAATLTEKARRWGLGNTVSVLLRHQALGTSWPEVVCQAVAHAEATSARVLVVDTFAEWAGLAGDAENSAGAVLAAMLPLQWAAARGLAVLLVAHQRKAQGEHGEAVRGSSALAGAVDIILELERPPEGIALPATVRVLRGVGRFESTPAEAAIELSEAGYQVRGTVPEAEMAAQRQAILAYLATAEAVTADQVAEAVGVPKATAHRRLAELLAAAEVHRSGSGRRGDPFRWSLVPDSEFVSSI